jgi:hypothetical protein
MVQELLAVLQARTVAYTERADPSGVLADQALDEASQLWQAAEEAAASDGGLPLDVALTVAWLHWCRPDEVCPVTIDPRP